MHSAGIRWSIRKHSEPCEGPSMTTATVLGLGEAGRIYAAGLAAAGFRVLGYDPYADARAEGVDQRSTLHEALAGSDVVISLVGAAAAEAVAADALELAPPSAVYADFNTASPLAKKAMAAAAQVLGIRFADVAVLAPVPRSGIRTPLLASGDGAEAAVELFSRLGVPIEFIGAEAGDAAARKLVRSIFMKGLAALVIETAQVGDTAGVGDWIRKQMAAELGPDGEALLERLFSGTAAHAPRRRHEVQDALDYAREVGARSPMAEGTLDWLAWIEANGLPVGGQEGTNDAP
ncbi:DUF1932 domain-containing protein [Arthrobacter sp. 7Tela_A1]|uniref:DUF1932 domain-containing protein n=1 Tax=Arthrobacter sp. 7Tela_A1 TaxID=3093745 RepID=UPI003BB7735E